MRDGQPKDKDKYTGKHKDNDKCDKGSSEQTSDEETRPTKDKDKYKANDNENENDK